ncbi:MAG TPA: PHB depolymerase family esterase, partial [Polyangia bacterium]
GGGGSGGGGSGGWGGGGGNWITPGADMGGGKVSCGGCSATGDAAAGSALPIALVLAAMILRRRARGGRPARLVALALLMMGPRALAAGQFVADSFGGRAYKLYVPSAYAGQPLPLVLMLHGCTQDPDQFATGTDMNAVAEAHGFFALYPDEPTSAQSLKCWQWFDPAHQQRGTGEPAALVALVDHVASQYAVDGARTYVAGLSAGAAMSVVLGATYPDRFSAIVVAAGLEYAAAASLAGASTAQLDGGPDPAQQGKLAAMAMSGVARPVRVLVFHGTADAVVAPLNGDQVAAQWRDTDAMLGAAVPATADSTEMAQAPGGRSYTTTRWGDWVQKVAVDGMGHAWAGGSAAGSYTDPKGPSASELAWQFFAGAAPGGGGGGGGAGGGNPTTTPPSMRAGCAFAGGGGGGSTAHAWWLALGLLAARKRATPFPWTRCSGSTSCSPRRA